MNTAYWGSSENRKSHGFPRERVGSCRTPEWFFYSNVRIPLDEFGAMNERCNNVRMLEKISEQKTSEY